MKNPGNIQKEKYLRSWPADFFQRKIFKKYAPEIKGFFFSAYKENITMLPVILSEKRKVRNSPNSQRALDRASQLLYRVINVWEWSDLTEGLSPKFFLINWVIGMSTTTFRRALAGRHQAV